MKTVEDHLSQYKSVHFNKRNIQTHFIGIPLIVWAISVLLSLHTFETVIGSNAYTYTPAMVVLAAMLLFYFKLHVKLAIGMAVYLVVNIYLAMMISTMDNALVIAVIAFIVGWIIQFIGHHFEKAKPAFVDDIMGLIIGPLFLMAEVYFGLGFEKKLNERITPMAVEKRKIIEKAKHK